MVTKTDDDEPSVFHSLPKFLLLNGTIALGITLLLCPDCLFVPGGFRELSALFILSLVLSSALSYGGYEVNRRFEGKISWLKHPVKRLVFTAMSYFIYTLVVSTILLAGYAVFTSQTVSLGTFRFEWIAQEVFFSITVAFFIITVFMARSWLMQWKKSALETERLRAELAENRYTALVNQLNPHFLFNSLNVLCGLVYEDADKSARFTRKLSQIYRYLIDVQNEELVELEKEIKFARDYLSLQKVRFEEKLTFDIKVGDIAGYYLPPLSLQLLLENAVKHNTATVENPLSIRIEQHKGNLVVENNVHITEPKDNESNEGIGLTNINKRYKLLGKRTPIIRHDVNFFRVELPLLTLEK